MIAYEEDRLAGLTSNRLVWFKVQLNYFLADLTKGFYLPTAPIIP